MIPSVILIAFGCFFALALIEPSFMRWLCARGIGWALALELFRVNLREAIRRSEAELGLEQGGPMLVRRERSL